MAEKLPIPDAPAKRLRPAFKAGDPPLSDRDITASTNEVPGVGGDMHYERGITRREDRDRFLSGKEYAAMSDRAVAAGQRRHQRRLDGRVPTRLRKVSR